MSLVSADYGSDEEDNIVNNNSAPTASLAPKIQPAIQPAKENKFQNITKINTEVPDDGKKRKINFVVPLKVIKDSPDDEDEIQRPQKKQKIGASLAQLLPKPKQQVEDKPIMAIKSSTNIAPSPLLTQYGSDEEDIEEEEQIQPVPSAPVNTINAVHNNVPSKPASDEGSAEEDLPVPSAPVKKPTATAPKSAPKQIMNLRAQMIRAINTKSETTEKPTEAAVEENNTSDTTQQQECGPVAMPQLDPASAEYAAYYQQYYGNYYDPNAAAYYAQQGYQYDPAAYEAYPEPEPFQQQPARDNMEELMRKNPELRKALESAPIMTVNASEHLGDPRLLSMGKNNKEQTKLMLEASAARADVSRTGKSRHHISYLVAEYKSRELQHSEIRAQQAHNRAESRKKYGW